MAENEEKTPLKQVACEVYSRIVGYLRPVQDWNKGKQQEFAERKTYAVPPSPTPADPSPKSN